MIEWKDVRFRYQGSTEDTLNIPHLEIGEGTFVALMGANGSGKTTAAFCMNGILRPMAGDVIVDGKNTRDPSALLSIRQCVGMVFQDPNLQFTSMSVEQELAFGLENRGMLYDEMHERVEEQLRRFQLQQYREQVPASLSGGEKQRLAFAAVLILNPHYLVLDEVTTFLSDTSATELLDRVAELPRKRGKGVILITQNPREALMADRLIVLDHGSVAFDGTPESVFSYGQELEAMGVPIPLRSRLGLQ